jgi:long-chain acyl-CoA synthetase
MTPFIFCIIPADISTVLCDKQNKAESLLQNREKGQTPVLKTIVIMDPFDAELVTRGAQCGLEVLSLADVEVGEVRHTLAAVRMASSLCSD